MFRKFALRKLEILDFVIIFFFAVANDENFQLKSDFFPNFRSLDAP